MDITVTARRMTMTEALKEYAEEKVASATRVFDITPMSAEVVLHVERNPANAHPAVAEITVRTKGHVIRVEEAEEDMYAAIDVAAAKCERQLRKFKTRVVDKKLHAAKPGSAAARESESALEALADEIERNEDVVRVKEIEFMSLSEEEALIQIDLLGHDFFIYTDRTTEETHVLYRRKDGGYGLIKPQA
jgi:putative sigma-54 modulation protein